MEARWLTRKNDEGVEEKFYPITHVNAMVINETGTTFDELLELISTTFNPSYVKYTIEASKWVGESAPYTYALTGYDNKTVEVLEDVTMSMDQLEAIESAKIKSDASSSNHILYAFGDKPSIDLPVLLKVY